MLPFQEAAAPATRRRVHWGGAACALLAPLVCALLALACGTSSDDGNAVFDASVAGDGSTGGPDTGTVGTFGDSGVHPADAGASTDALVIPENFVKTEKGGYALGPPVTGDGSDAGVVQNGGSSNCSLVVGIVRDMASYQIQSGGHPDFERFSGSAATKGLVNAIIGADRKPVYGAECDDKGSPDPACPFGQQMTTKANFDQWYRYTPNVNQPYVVYLQFVPNGSVYTFQSTAFLPLDGAGSGNTPGFTHNFSFTTELHLKFTYGGGETFSFTGDDDLWVFIDGKLAIDLGGLHSPVNGAVSLDTLGLTRGTTYDIELFNAERHSTGSTFRVDTNLAFTNCGTLPPDVPR
jgi:fibro-slime domain-containing protein